MSELQNESLYPPRPSYYNKTGPRENILGIGISGVVYQCDEHTAVKFAPITDNERFSAEQLADIRTERCIYERLGSHNRICSYKGPVQRGLLLEKMEGCLRKRLREMVKEEMHDSWPHSRQVLTWSLQAAEGLAYAHSKGVLQSDVGCHNLLLDKAGDIKLCDFAGSSIDGSEAKVCYGERSQMPSNSPDPPTSVQTEVFALGSTMYEMATLHEPFMNTQMEMSPNVFKRKHFLSPKI